MPSPAARYAGMPSMRSPSNVMVPERGRSKPEMVFTNVDLPAPFGPSTATISPACIASSAFHSTWKSP